MSSFTFTLLSAIQGASVHVAMFLIRGEWVVGELSQYLQPLRPQLSSLYLPSVHQVYHSTFLISRSNEANLSRPENLI